MGVQISVTCRTAKERRELGGCSVILRGFSKRTMLAIIALAVQALLLSKMMGIPVLKSLSHSQQESHWVPSYTGKRSKEITKGDEEDDDAMLVQLQNLSSVDYRGCCGLGHRLTKMSNAYLVSRRLHLALRAFWGYCTFDQQQQSQPQNESRNRQVTTQKKEVEVFHHLFRPQPLRELKEQLRFHQRRASASAALADDYAFGHYLFVANEVPTFDSLYREGPPRPESSDSPTCQCTEEQRGAYFDMYAGLRERFRFRSRIDQFRRQHFGHDLNDNGSQGHPRRRPAVLGVHIRAGNGETGDFVESGRGMQDFDSWLESLASLIAEARPDGEWSDAVVFVASDTPSAAPKLQSLLREKQQRLVSHSNNSRSGNSDISSRRMTVVTLDQTRPAEGGGVMFGQHGSVLDSGPKCLEGWVSVMSDMILLSHADAVIAARLSSFTQAMPLSLVFGSPTTPSASEAGGVPKEFCDVNVPATEMRCYRSFLDWCCNGTSRLGMEGMTYGGVEPVGVPTTNTSAPESFGGYHARLGGDSLPYDWAELP
jgi:hypothetical protein